MAQKTELSATGVPGRVHSFVAKAGQVYDPVPGIQFTNSDDRLDFTAAPRFDFSSEDV